MRFSAVAATLATFSVAAAQQRFVVKVGDNNGLTFDPETITAKAGDTLAFQFLSKNHTATQSTFDNPCVAKPDGIDSGFLFVPPEAPSVSEWSFTIVNDTASMWFFCAQGRHCQNGMVFALNPTAERTFEAFKATATGGSANGTNTTTPGAGGANGTTPSTNGTGSAADPNSTAGSAGNDAVAAMRQSKVALALTAIGVVAGLLL